MSRGRQRCGPDAGRSSLAAGSGLPLRQASSGLGLLSVGMLHRILILPDIMCGRIAGIVFTSTQFCFVRKNSTSSYFPQ